jgi:site-specific DNA-cytosine methylase
VAALRTLADLEQAAWPALPEEQAVLARWSGWGAVPAVFDEDDDRYAAAREELRALVDDDEWAAARRLRMLEPHEIELAMAFPAGYIPDDLTKRDRVKLAGNAVTPPVMTWITGRVLQALEAAAA